MSSGPTLIFVGGGLANGLAALRWAETHRGWPFLLIERGDRLGGEHTWSFHDSDLTPAQRSWMTELVTHSWPGYDVQFPGLTRAIEATYHSIRSADFHRHLMARLGSRVLLGTTVTEVRAEGVRLEDGTWLGADLVVDGRGQSGGAFSCGYQKFFGWFVTTARPHPFQRPVVMDATVDQRQGYRFVYVLPWSATELLVEDTYYSEDPALDEARLRRLLASYLEGHGVTDYTVTGEERGVLPIPYHGAEPPSPAPGVLLSGMAAGLFHPTTGYSLAEAVRFADWLSQSGATDRQTLAARAASRAQALWRRGAFFRRLNNMLLLAASPPERAQVLERFYARDEALIRRFYAGRLAPLDPLRILSGRPPIAVTPALKAFFRKVAHGV